MLAHWAHDGESAELVDGAGGRLLLRARGGIHHARRRRCAPLRHARRGRRDPDPVVRPGAVLTALALYGLASIAVTAGLVKLGVAAVSTFEIGYGRALAAGLASGLLSLVPLLVILSRPAQPGTLIGLGLLSLPLSLAALLLHAWLVASLAEHRPAQI